jgi:hypothetical protein
MTTGAMAGTAIQRATHALAEEAETAQEALRDAAARAGGRLDGSAAMAGAAFETLARSALTAAQELAVGSLTALADEQERLQELMEALERTQISLREGDLSGLEAALEDVLGTLGAGHEIVGGLSALATPMEWARGVVHTINELLEAMNLGL